MSQNRNRPESAADYQNEPETSTYPGHEHEWVVFSTALQEGWLMLQCVECGRHGTVNDPTREEWSAGYHAPSKPYRWADIRRVTVRKNGPRYVARSESNPGQYERIPRELMGRVRPVTAKEADELESLAQVAIDGRLDGSQFPVFLRSFMRDAGYEPSETAIRLACRLEEWSGRGFLAPPETVASVLKWYAREGRPTEETATNDLKRLLGLMVTAGDDPRILGNSDAEFVRNVSVSLGWNEEKAGLVIREAVELDLIEWTPEST